MNDLPTSTPPPVPEPILARPFTPASLPADPQPLDLAALSRRDAALDLALFLLVALLIPVGFELAAVLTMPEVPELSFSNFIIVQKWFDALLLVVLAGYFVYRHHLAPAAFGLRGDRPARQVFWAIPTLLAVYGAFFLFVIVIGAAVMLFPDLEKDLVRRTEFMEMLPLSDTLSIVLLLVPVAIHEELLFRGLLIPYLHRVGCSWVVAVLISTVVFAVLHVTQGWLGIIQIFGVGAMLGACFVLTRSLLAVMLAHFLFDFFQTQLARVVIPWMEQLAQQVQEG